MAIGLGPAAVLFGWFYVRIQLLYGDVGASTFLLEHFDREPRGSIPTCSRRAGCGSHLFHRMASTAPLSWAWPRFANLVGLVGRGRSRRRHRPAAERARSRRAIALCLLAVAVITLTVAQHLAGGGSPYPRYFFPVLGVLAALAAVGYDRSLPRLLPAVVVVAMAWWAVNQMPIGVDPVFTRRPRDNGAVPPPALRVLPVGDGWRMVAAGVIVTGAVVIVTALCLGLRAVEAPNRAVESGLRWPRSCAHDRSSSSA